MLSVVKGGTDKIDNVLKNAPHTARHVTSDIWDHSYGREEAAYPTEWTKKSKFWPSVGRLDNAFGDRNLMCTCPPITQFDEKL